ncbi:MAG: phosphatidate cytidylyltransferase [Kiritimatiellae bacterium]|nr:phosphatidate cytidylyltransferase [Kiritimatiellia bacterium]
MVRRIITGLLIGIAWIAALCFMPGWLLCVILCVMSCLCQAEFYGMLRKGVTRLPSSPLWGMALGCIWLVYTYLFPPETAGAAYQLDVLAALVFAFMLRVLFMRGQERPIEYATVTISGFLYLPFMLSFLIRIAQWGSTEIGRIAPDRSGIFMAFFLAAAVKFSDVGGFAFGIPFGKHKLAPTISPKKSWEGLAGSFIVSGIVSVGFVLLAKRFAWLAAGPLETLPIGYALLFSAILVVVGLLGDLVESRFKRAVEIKDSATLLPGLGGFLDMFDSLVFAPAVFYLVLTAIVRITA